VIVIIKGFEGVGIEALRLPEGAQDILEGLLVEYLVRGE
jgi:hypothetical protein